MSEAPVAESLESALDPEVEAPVLRVGGIDYLNSLPLLWGLDRPRVAAGDAAGVVVQLENHVPSRLASLLRAGELDVALVPVVAWADRDDYEVVPGIGIASFGAVRSIRLWHRESLDRCGTVLLDACSRTSQLLTRLLFREAWGAEPRFVEARPDEIRQCLEGGSSTADGALLIGDAALARESFDGWADVDLGTAWTRWTGLPFVYAFWLCRGADTWGPVARKALVERLERARWLGQLRIDEIVGAADLPPGIDPSGARHYLQHLIRFELGPDELAGLRLFQARLDEAGLSDFGRRPLRFLA